jgi:hypothetical protein
MILVHIDGIVCNLHACLVDFLDAERVFPYISREIFACVWIYFKPRPVTAGYLHDNLVSLIEDEAGGPQVDFHLADLSWR